MTKTLRPVLVVAMALMLSGCKDCTPTSPEDTIPKITPAPTIAPTPEPSPTTAPLPISVTLVSPADGSTSGLVVRFEWHIVNRQPGDTFNCEIRVDKGWDPFDTHVEDIFQVGDVESRTLSLDRARFSQSHIWWGVRCTDITATGNPHYDSYAWLLEIS